MSLEVAININLLNTILEELRSAITHAATDFEAYLADRNNQENIRHSQEGISQVGGIFRLLEYRGAALLADEMAALEKIIADPDIKTSEAMINALTNAFFILPSYIEFITVKQHELPILVIPYVNELRASRRVDLIPEWHFFESDIPSLGLMEVSSAQSDIPSLLATAPRLRHMYQTGLVGVIKNPDSAPHLQFMRRAITRFLALLGNHPSAEIWQIASAVLEAFVADKMEITLNRKRVLAEVEKMLRTVVSKGEEGLNEYPSANLKKDLLFILMLTNISRPEVDAVRKSYSLPVLGTTDAEIRQQREAIHGPSIDTIESVIAVLNSELGSAKDILEIASQNNSIEHEDVEALRAVMARVADTLQVLNLSGPKDMLKEQLDGIDNWSSETGEPVGREGFNNVADTILYVESVLSSLDRREVTVDDINKANERTRRKIVARSQLAKAQMIVLDEAQSGIALAKRAITSYVDSNFDKGHIANVSTTLDTVRGGLKVLNYSRAAAILKSCSDFITDHINTNDQNSQRFQLLETLADALISLEYYLSELLSSRDVDENVLEIAEQSLEALGYSVEKK